MPTDEETYLLLAAAEVDRKVYASNAAISGIGFTEAQADANIVSLGNIQPFILPAGKELWGRTSVPSNTFRYMTTVAR